MVKSLTWEKGKGEAISSPLIILRLLGRMSSEEKGKGIEFFLEKKIKI